MKANYKVVTLREQVHGFIKSRILDSDIKPGEKINEIELAEELGTSRGPVREALRQLEQEGLVLYEANKGCTVTKLTPIAMYEMSLIRAHLEILAVELCAGNYSDETLEKMSECVDLMEQYDYEKKLGKVIEEDQKFHKMIVREPGLPHLLKLWHTLDGTNIAIFSTMDAIDELCWGNIGQNHRRILEGFKSKDIEVIKEDLGRHYGNISQFREKFIKK